MHVTVTVDTASLAAPFRFIIGNVNTKDVLMMWLKLIDVLLVATQLRYSFGTYVIWHSQFTLR